MNGMTALAAVVCLVVVIAVLWFASRPITKNHAARDEQHTAQVKANAERTAKSAGKDTTMITKKTNPRENLDAMRAMNAAVRHHQALQKWDKTRSPVQAHEVQAWMEIREDHQKKTGWVAEHQGEGEWRFTYMDPATRLTGGTAVIITTKEK